MQAQLTMDAMGLFAQNCTIDIGPAPGTFTGRVELDIDDADYVTGEVDLDYEILAVTEYEVELHPSATDDESCNRSSIDDMLGYLGYSIDDFVAEDFEQAASDIRGELRNLMGNFNIPAACSSDAALGETSLSTDIYEYAHDGECDDGGTGSDFAVCDYGTDCDDCGPR